jgi:hypothetical protein
MLDGWPRPAALILYLDTLYRARRPGLETDRMVLSLALPERRRGAQQAVAAHQDEIR